MGLLLKLSWRNIWRNKRRSLLTLIAIVFATMTAIAMRGVQIGTYDVNIKYVLNLFSGYIQVQKAGFQKDNSLTKNFKFSQELQNILSENKLIKGFAPRVMSGGLISFKNNSQGAALIGFSPKHESASTTIMNRLMEGSFFASDTSYDIVVGYKLLKNLNAKIGDEVVVLSQGIDGSLGNLKFKISGTVKFGNPEMDLSAVFVALNSAQELLAMENRIHSIVITLSSQGDLDEVKTGLQNKINDASLVVLDWGEVLPEFKQSIDLDNVSGALMLLILVIIVAFGILNTVLMSVTERFKEFGVSLSIGMPQIKLVTLIIMETVFIASIGILLGDLIGYGINSYIHNNPITLGAEFEQMYEEYGFLPIIESSVDLIIFLNTSLVIFVISIISVLYPAYKVYKLEPLKGIRYT
ncbi:MAG: ABC transporter permease [Bacteroidetes bacterium]|nr:ABC transporter permease [Bacteroidota bacterium]